MNLQLKEMMAQQQMAQQTDQQEDYTASGVLQQSRGPRQPRQMPRGANPGKNYTFNDQKLMGMAHENQVLLSKISRIAVSSGTGMSSAPDTYRKKNKMRSSHGINRRRAENRVANENMAFLKRLQNVK